MFDPLSSSCSTTVLLSLWTEKCSGLSPSYSSRFNDFVFAIQLTNSLVKYELVSEIAKQFIVSKQSYYHELYVEIVHSGSLVGAQCSVEGE
jgi:hypothetical protein